MCIGRVQTPSKRFHRQQSDTNLPFVEPCPERASLGSAPPTLSWPLGLVEATGGFRKHLANHPKTMLTAFSPPGPAPAPFQLIGPGSPSERLSAVVGVDLVQR